MEPKDDRPTAVAKGRTDSCGLGTLGKTWNGRWSLSSPTPWLYGVRYPAGRSPRTNRKRPHHKIQPTLVERVTLWRPWRLPGLLPNMLDSRIIRSVVGPKLAPVLGFPWSCRWVAMLAMTVTGKVVTAKVGIETGNSSDSAGTESRWP